MSEAHTLLYQFYLIVQWIFLSSTIILFNKHLLSSRHFHFPLTLVMMHMAFVSACAHLYRYLGWTEAPNISWRDVGTRFVPIAALFAASLGFGNAAYLYISVAFVQMLKAATPVAVLLCSFALGLEQPNAQLGGYVVLIAIGVAIACYGQLQLDWTGVMLQIGAVLAEALRLCLVNIALTARGIKLPSVTFLSVVAPLCAAVLLPAWAYLEAAAVCRNRFAPIRHLGFLTLLANASVAFLLNLATMALIKNTSALTLNVSGVFKDIGLILFSVGISGAVVTNLQYGGYALAILGVSLYSAYKRAQAASPTPEPPASGPPRGIRSKNKRESNDDEEEEAEPLASPPKC